MIHSLFMINEFGNIFMEKHWKSVVSKNICKSYVDQIKKCHSQQNVQSHMSPPSVVSLPNNHFLITVKRRRIYFVAVCMNEVPPLFVIEFLHRIVDIFVEYFGESCSEATIKDNYVVVYELLDEMLDNGFPLATEPNILKELIKPPNIIRSVVNTVTGKSNMSDVLPVGQLSNVPWRRSGVKYNNNEAYFDVCEELDVTLDKSGSVVFSQIRGSIVSTSKLSGMPLLIMSFMNSNLFDDVSFHPCVRYKMWDVERVLSFIPPDGTFQLMSYVVDSRNILSIPICIRHSLHFPSSNNTGHLDISLSPKQLMGRVLENVCVEIPLEPREYVVDCSMNATVGKVTFDPVQKRIVWKIGKMEGVRGATNLKGNITLQSGGSSNNAKAVMANSSLSMSISFLINQMALSGVKVSRLDVQGERYKPFKGVKYITRDGKFNVRL